MATTNIHIDEMYLAQLHAQLEPKEANALITKLIELFVADSLQVPIQIANAIGSKDGSALRRIAHHYAATCGTIGAEHLRAICMDIERCGLSSRFDEAAHHTNALTHEISAVTTELMAMNERLRHR